MIDKKLELRFDENGNGFANLDYDGIEIATCYSLGNREIADRLAEILVKINGTGDIEKIAHYLIIKASYLRQKDLLKRTTNPFEQSEKNK